MRRVYCLLFLVLLFFLKAENVFGSIVIGIDLGTESFKVAMIYGRQFELVLNEQSSRKTPNLIGFSPNNERVFGEMARRMITRIPTRVYSSLVQVVGRSLDNPILQQVVHHIPYKLVKDEARGTAAIHHDENTTFSPEELLGMILQQAKHIASVTAKTDVKDCVITVPPFLTEYERRGILTAAKLAGLHVLSLMHDGSAVAMQYALTQDISEEEKNVIFYDVGAGSLKASVVTFKRLPIAKTNKTTPHFAVRAVAWDQTLGGREFDHRIAEYLAGVVNSERPNEEDIRENTRAFAKLKREAQTVKEILSANQETRIMIEGLIGDYDLKTHLTRDKFEEICSDLFERATKPLETLLQTSNLTAANISAVELLGGGTRIPKLLKRLAEFFGRSSLDHHLNSDEAAVFGATFRAAVLSSGFSVQTDVKFRDISTFPIAINVNLAEPQTDTKENEELQTTLFKKDGRLDSRKNLSFTTLSNFSIDLAYEALPQLPEGIPLGIRRYIVTGLPFTEQYNFTSKPKVSVSFHLTSSGIIEIGKVEAQATYVTYEKPRNITSAKNNTQTSTKTETESTETKPSEEKTETESETKRETETESTETKSVEENTESTTQQSESPSDILVPIQRSLRRTLKVVEISLSTVQSVNDTGIFKSTQKLKEWDRKDQLKKETEEAKNSLEAFVYEMKERINDEKVQEMSTEEERGNLSSQLDSCSDWLYEEGADATLTEYKKRLRDMTSIVSRIKFRIDEEQKRPEAIAQFLDIMNFTKHFLVNMTELFNVTEEEVTEVQQQINSHESWLREQLQIQRTKKPNEDPAFTTAELQQKSKEVQTKVSRFLRRKRRVPVSTSAEDSSKNSTSTESENQKSESTPTPPEQPTAENVEQEAKNIE